MAAAAGDQPDLYPYQRYVVDWLTANPTKSLLLAHGMGTGKTRTAVAAMKASNQQFVLIAPIAVQGAWEREIERQNCEALLFPGGILNANGIYSFFRNPANRQRLKDIYDFLRQGAALVIDEAHKFKTMKPDGPANAKEYKEWVAKRLSEFLNPPEDRSDQLVPWRFRHIAVQAVCELADRACRVVALTGTPMLNAPSDFAIYYRLCLNRPLRKQLFYFTPAQFNAVFTGPQGPTSRFAELACGMVSVVELTDAEKRANWKWPYQFDDRVESISVTEEAFGQIATTERGRYLSRLRTAMVERKVQSAEFLIAIHRIVEEIGKSNKSTKFAIYSNFIEKGLDIIQRMLDDKQIRYSTITGKTSKQSKEEQDKYNNGVVNVILLSPAAQEGVDLKNTNVMFIMDLNWNQAQHDQIRARTFRLNSHSVKTYDFNRAALQRCAGWVLLTAADPVTGNYERQRYLVDNIPMDKDFKKMQFVRDQTVIVKTFLLMTRDDVLGSDKNMLELGAAKSEVIDPYIKALKTVSIETKVGGCPPVQNLEQLVTKASQDFYQDAYVSGQDARSTCYEYACSISPTLAQGDCFFDATRKALAQIKVMVTVQQLREKVAEKFTIDLLQHYSQFQGEFEILARPFKAAISKLTDESRLLAARNVVRSPQYYADENSINVIGEEYRILYVIVREDRAPNTVTLYPSSPEFVFDFVVPLWHSGEKQGAHYQNISCDGKMIYAQANLPPFFQDALRFRDLTTHSYQGQPHKIIRGFWSKPTYANPMPTLDGVRLQNIPPLLNEKGESNFIDVARSELV